jgi:hypothetical protein
MNNRFQSHVIYKQTPSVNLLQLKNKSNHSFLLFVPNFVFFNALMPIQAA